MVEKIISLTTIPPRMHEISPTIDSLLRQTADVDRIILNIPRQYRRPDFGKATLPDFPKGVEVNVCDVDYGPATKVLATLELVQGREAIIIYCDDDRIYAPSWAEMLLSKAREFPGECVVESGALIGQVEARYRYKNRTSGRISGAIDGLIYTIKKPRTPAYGVVDIAEGFGGVLVRPSYFDRECFDIPDRLWMVDDIWLSGHMSRRGVRIRKISARPNSEKTALAGVSSLVEFTHDASDRTSADMECVNYFREKYRIWL